MRLSRTRDAVVVFGALLLVAMMVGQTGLLPSDGPYPRTDPAGVDFELAPGVPATWGMPLPGSTGETFVLQTIEPLGVEGLDILGVSVCRWSGVPDEEGIYHDCAPIASRTWPPVGTTLLPVDGTVLTGETPFASVVIGVERQAGATVARIDAIRIVYTANGKTYEVTEPWTLNLVDPGTLTGG